MHKATCNNCGKDCEVPFKPTSGKPIFCSNCFDKTQKDDSNKFSRDRGDRSFRGGDSRKRSFDDRDSVAHKAVCDKCGKECEVPFRPTKGKPIYCEKCFGSNKEQDTDQFKKEFGILNKKLDGILEILTSLLSTNKHQEEFEAETVKETVEEIEVPKKAKKKVAIKKEVIKKEPIKKDAIKKEPIKKVVKKKEVKK
ncbi:MAG: hypothetical protein KKA84_14630 [Bacteroidetes bacterium]|nr:hypothetical protein [Bacteroidota bacterium]